MPTEKVKSFKIARLLDKTTLIIKGDGTGDLKAGESMCVVSITKVSELDAPIVLPKVKLKVTIPSVPYAVVRTPEKEVEVEDPFHVRDRGPRTRTVRGELKVSDGELMGNPSFEPVQVGDVVVRETDLSSFISQQVTK